MPDGARTILLAGPSLLYAPVFLAKYCRLSPVFDHLELDWEPERREASHRSESACSDPVLAALLERNRHHDVVIAVCDPCRVGYLPQHIGDLHDPVLLCGLIGKMCLNYSMIEQHPPDEFFDDEDVLTTAAEVIVNDPEMTSFAITAELLKLLNEAGRSHNPVFTV